MPEQWRVRNVSQTLDAFDALPVEPMERKRELRVLVESAAVRHWTWQMRFALHFGLTPMILIATFPASLVWFFGSERARYGIFACAATLVLASIWETALFRTLGARVFFLLPAGLGAYFWVMMVRASSNSGHKSVIALVGMVILVFVSIPVLFYLSRKYARSARVRCHPHDFLLISAVLAAGVVGRGRDKWRSTLFVRNAHGALEALAVRAHLSLALKGRVDVLDFGLRRELRLEAQRVAASIRSLKSTISTASGPESVDRVLESLINGIEAIAKIDRQALLDGAPPLPSGVSRLRAAAARILPGAVLVGAAFLVPLIPAIAANGHVASTVRWTLLVTGVTWIVSASSEATGRVGDVLGKVLPFK
ncbi:hypothetical protein ACIQB5_15575 [Streptomyces sp. NPDC088560]|uniref:hypothetical protein n=1 Tax=Streptomyces sp. NPDC088560 TaxID=3365868 RepID=UPI00380B4EB9